ncbi:oxygen-dependent tRNA uridine(34) hydroxylase TrhO [Myroides pelagicus]|uniref:tRNA uridine(34) hydroxylase n=1 Tax=Myroides pelagicus TaxID=270914 RepID=A0A7K1GJ42_9FLAO|nr:rhodanese-related sulfurtransferase [Myroides pelagicus]MEC4113639.1 rhodanese-related sulfurtransferase [Myroides pelagicus]MTH28836.1 rhodanese-related sulfurtransferase [Myroides pelagicus]
MQLYNTLSAEERAELIEQAGENRLTLSFYAYAKIENPQQFRDDLFLAWDALGALGRTYVAHEGINAQMSVPASKFDAFRDTLEQYDFMKGIRLNVAVEQDDLSFLKLTVKVRNKIVADGLNDATFDVTNKGIHLKAKEFNTILEDPNTVVVDFRNHYESEVGHFVGAITPDVDTFRESLPIIKDQLEDIKEEKNLVMYCTGGIRCEKASAYFKHHGFKNVYQLEGGIIEYTRQVKAEGLESKFIGKNFVFDHRLGERITDDIISNCHQCGKPCDTHVNCANEACHLLFIQCDECAEQMHGCCSDECLDIIQLPVEEQKRLRQGVQKGNLVFKKGRSEALKFQKERAATGDIKAVKVSAVTQIRKKQVVRKVLIGIAQHYFTKVGVGQFIVDKEINVGDKIAIVGPTTGDERLTIEKMMVNGAEVSVANKGDKMTMELSFRIRKNDQLYKIID